MERVKEILTASTFEVFEKMFYLFLEPGDRCLAHDCRSSVRFDGLVRGVLHLQATRPLAAVMAENLLGAPEAGSAPEQVQDCLKEAANMVCGNFLVNLNPAGRFSLSLPDWGGQPPAAEAEGALRLDFDTERGRLGVILELEEAKG